jgi:hypothetical protein
MQPSVTIATAVFLEADEPHAVGYGQVIGSFVLQFGNQTTNL